MSEQVLGACSMRLFGVLLVLGLIISMKVGASFGQAEFNHVIDQVESAYPVTSKNEKIRVNRAWSGSLLGDSAVRLPFLTQLEPVVILTGRVPQEYEVTQDAFALLVCHEFGHHLAQGPRIGL